MNERIISQGTAHFVVTGEAITEMARDLLLSDEPGRAYRLMADCLIGDGSVEAALSVLAGTHDLAGDSNAGLELVEAHETPERKRFLSDFRYIYAGRFKSRRGWLRPVAWISTFGMADGDWACKQVDGAIGSPIDQSETGKLRRWWDLRARYYCQDVEQPFILKVPPAMATDHEIVGDHVYVIFEPCGELPHWIAPNITAQDALTDALDAHRRLEERKAELVETDESIRPRRRSKEEIQRQIEAEDRQEAERKKLLDKIGADVRAQAGDDTFELTLKDGRVLTVPRAPFVRWALHRTPESKQAPAWNNVAPSGVRMQLDNPDHTDWILGAGITIDESYYDDAIREASWDALFRFQEEARASTGSKRPAAFSGILSALEGLRNMSHPAAVVVDAGSRTGVVGVEIAVFPDSGTDRVQQIGEAQGVIVEQGGPLAHFSVVSRGKGITVMRCADACEEFPTGTRVQLDPERGRVLVLQADDEDTDGLG